MLRPFPQLRYRLVAFAISQSGSHVTPRLCSYLSFASSTMASTMQHHHITPPQHIEDDPTTLSNAFDPFTVTVHNGFMPLRTPIIDPPNVFQPVVKSVFPSTSYHKRRRLILGLRLVEDLPIVKLDGSPGLLAKYQLGPTIDLSDALPDLTSEIDKLVTGDGQPDLALVTALFRDYAFIASAYLLEPCYERWSKGLEGYGLGRQRLPRQIAGPLVKTAEM